MQNNANVPFNSEIKYLEKWTDNFMLCLHFTRGSIHLYLIQIDAHANVYDDSHISEANKATITVSLENTALNTCVQTYSTDQKNFI